MNRFAHWSRRKRGLEDHHQAPQASPTVPAEDTPLAEAEAEAVTEDEESLALSAAEPEHEIKAGELDDQLPDPDTLEPGSDFKPFLLPGVSPELKRRALRRMFSASSYNVRDGLDDYDQDYSKMRSLSKKVAEQLRHWGDKLSEDKDAAIPEDTVEEEARHASRQEHEGEHDEKEDKSDADRQTAEHSQPANMNQPDTRLGQTDTPTS